jgi:hypothetical protein
MLLLQLAEIDEGLTNLQALTIFGEIDAHGARSLVGLSKINKP